MSETPAPRKRPRLAYMIERALWGYIVRTEMDWFPAKTWEEALAIRDREQARFEKECEAIETENQKRQEQT